MVVVCLAAGMSKSNVIQESARPLEGTTNVKPLQVAVGPNHTLLLLPSPLLLLPETKKGGSSEGSYFRSLHLHLALISLSHPRVGKQMWTKR